MSATGADTSVGATQKGDIVKELMQKAFDLGINMFDVSGDHRAVVAASEMAAG